MNKVPKVVFVWMALMLSYQAHAQVKAGLRAGINYADLTQLLPKYGNGFHAGTYLKFSLASLLELEPGIQYSQRKFDVHPGYPGNSLHLNYIDVPIVVRMGLLPFVDVFAGPQASVLVARKYKGGGQFDRTTEFHEQELGALVGIGVSLPLGINIQGSYDFGLSNPVHNGHEIKNRIFKISLGKDF
jgi:hypothetical protein